MGLRQSGQPLRGCVHQVAVHEHCSKTVWDRIVLAYNPGILRVFCSDGFPYVIPPAFSTPAFSTPAIYSCIFHSCIFHPCYLLLHFPLLQFPLPRFQRPQLAHPFKIAELERSLCHNWARLYLFWFVIIVHGCACSDYKFVPLWLA